METIRILHVVRQFYPAVGGLETYVKSMAEHQINLGHECAVLTLNRIFHGDKGILPEFETVENIPVYRVSFLGRRRFFLPLVTPSFLKRYDVIHVHNTDGFFDCIAFLAQIIGKPVFATTHGGFFHTKDFLTIKNIYFDLITRNFGKCYNAIFAISQNDFDTFKGVNDNLLLKPNAIEPPGDFIATGKDFVYLGRLAKHKNIPALIKTFSILKSKSSVEGKLHIIGPEWDTGKAELSGLADDLGIKNDVVFHGLVSSERLREILQNCGWFLSASSYEGFGMSMLESMAVGLAPFVQPNESFRELIAAAGVGACVDFTLPEQAAKDIAKGMNSIDEDDRKKARNFALGFSWEKLAQDTIATYKGYAR